MSAVKEAAVALIEAQMQDEQYTTVSRVAKALNMDVLDVPAVAEALGFSVAGEYVYTPIPIVYKHSAIRTNGRMTWR